MERLLETHHDVEAMDAFFDDGAVVGPPAVLMAAALRALFELVLELRGSSVRMPKCKVYSPEGDPSMSPQPRCGGRVC